MTNFFTNLAKNQIFDRTNLETNDLRLTTPHILIVEDDPFSQRLFTNIINDTYQNLNISIVSSYEQARDVLSSNQKIKLAIIDIYLESEKSGIDLLKFIKFSHPHATVIITSSLSKDKAFDLMSSFDELPTYLQKPFSPKECQTVLKNLKPTFAED
jgi:response regulator of citrate/malate metabolism